MYVVTDIDVAPESGAAVITRSDASEPVHEVLAALRTAVPALPVHTEIVPPETLNACATPKAAEVA